MPNSGHSVDTAASDKRAATPVARHDDLEATDGFDYEYIDLDRPADDRRGRAPKSQSRPATEGGSGFEEHVAPPPPDDPAVPSKRAGASAKGGRQLTRKTPKSDSDSPKKTAKPLAIAEWDDIPVLQEVAAQPDEEIDANPSEGSRTIIHAGSKSDRFREIAIKVVAKLNIELRKCGERGLEPRTIDRLNFLLREALQTPKTGQSEKQKR